MFCQVLLIGISVDKNKYIVYNKYMSIRHILPFNLRNYQMLELTKEEKEWKKLLLQKNLIARCLERMYLLREQIEDNNLDLGLSENRTQLSYEIYSIMKSVNAISWYFPDDIEGFNAK